MWCFAHFDLQMCFAPQRRTIFGHLTFRKWSEHVFFCAFWLTNVLRAAAARTIFRHLIWNSKSCSERCGVLCILSCKFASRHKGAYHFSKLELQKLLTGMWCFGSEVAKSVPSWGLVHSLTRQMCFALHPWPFFHFGLHELLSPHPPLQRAYFSNIRKPRIIEKTKRFATFPNTWRVCIFFLVILLACWSSFCWLYSRVDLLSADLTSLFCFSTVHIVGS